MTWVNKVHMREKNLVENNLTRKTKSHKNVSIPWPNHTILFLEIHPCLHPSKKEFVRKRKLWHEVFLAPYIYITLKQQSLHDVYLPVSATILWASNPETVLYSSYYSQILEWYLHSANIWMPTRWPLLSNASGHRII